VVASGPRSPPIARDLLAVLGQPSIRMLSLAHTLSQELPRQRLGSLGSDAQLTVTPRLRAPRDDESAVRSSCTPLQSPDNDDEMVESLAGSRGLVSGSRCTHPATSRRKLCQTSPRSSGDSIAPSELQNSPLNLSANASVRNITTSTVYAATVACLNLNRSLAILRMHCAWCTLSTRQALAWVGNIGGWQLILRSWATATAPMQQPYNRCSQPHAGLESTTTVPSSASVAVRIDAHVSTTNIYRGTVTGAMLMSERAWLLCLALSCTPDIPSVWYG
jgi:hypothetical protein